jgi:hypothetical protein
MEVYMGTNLILIICAAIVATVSVLMVTSLMQRTRDENTAKKTNVLEYSDRYSNTISHIAEQVQDLNSDDFDQTNGKLRRWMIDFYKLIEAEHNLSQSKIIDSKTWDKWESGITKHLSQKVFRQGFHYVESQVSVNKFFLKYIKDKMERYNKEDSIVVNKHQSNNLDSNKIVQLQKVG